LLRRSLIAAAAVLLLASTLAPIVVAKANMAALCHYNATTDSYALINVSANGKAVDAHLAHGDGVPGGDVPTRPGSAFDDGCVPIAADSDSDGILDTTDNCPGVANPDQSDRYGSPSGDACEDDSNGDGILDIDETSICVSIDGVEIVAARGGATCFSDPSPGSEPNIAVAQGDGAWATAYAGNGNTATAYGSNPYASAYDGDNNTANADGAGAFALAAHGRHNIAIADAIGAMAYAHAPGGCTYVAPPSGACS